MVWNATGTFHTRLSATALTANRKFVFPDLDGTFVVASAGVVAVDRISASSVFANVLTISGNAIVGSLAVAGTMTVSGSTILGGTLTVSGAAAFIGNVSMAGTLTVSGAAVLGSLTVPGAATISAITTTGNVAVGGNLTVSGTAVVGNLTVPGRISASAGNVVGTFSAGGVHAQLLVARRQDTNTEGGEIEWTRAFDDAVQWAMDAIGSGTATANMTLRLFNANAGVPLFSWDLAGNYTVPGELFLGGASNVAPYNTVGSIVSTAGAAAKFGNTLKAWVSFNGILGVLINQSFNISAVTRAASGNYAAAFVASISTNASMAHAIQTLVTAGSGVVTFPANTVLSSSFTVVLAPGAAAAVDVNLMGVSWLTKG